MTEDDLKKQMTVDDLEETNDSGLDVRHFWDDFWKMKKGDNQSGNSTILGSCRQWDR